MSRFKIKNFKSCPIVKFIIYDDQEKKEDNNFQAL